MQQSEAVAMNYSKNFSKPTTTLVPISPELEILRQVDQERENYVCEQVAFQDLKVNGTLGSQIIRGKPGQ